MNINKEKKLKLLKKTQALLVNQELAGKIKDQWKNTFDKTESN